MRLDKWLRDARGGSRGGGGFRSLARAQIALFACPPWSGVIILSPTAIGDDTWACGALSAAAVRLRTPVHFLPSDDTRFPFVWSAYFPGGYGLSPSVVVRSECDKDAVSSLSISGMATLTTNRWVFSPSFKTPPTVTARKMTPAMHRLPPDGTHRPYGHPGSKPDLSEGVGR